MSQVNKMLLKEKSVKTKTSMETQEYYTIQSFNVGKWLMYYEDIENEINGRKQYDERNYEQTDQELLEIFNDLRSKLNIQLLSRNC